MRGKIVIVVAAIALSTIIALSIVPTLTQPPQTEIRGEEPTAGNWNTWVLSSGSELRLPPPPAPNSTQGAEELAQLERAQLERNQTQIDSAIYWDTGPATKRWTELQLDMILVSSPNPLRTARGLALMHIAMYDALVAAWDSKYAYNRATPSSVDLKLKPAIKTRENPSYPSEHAVVAGAASRVLERLFPGPGAEFFEAKAQEAAMSRVIAGANWPTDVEQGLALGRVVADRVLAVAAADGSNATWDGKRLTGPCTWEPNPNDVMSPLLPNIHVTPLAPTWGQVKPWVMVSGDQFRPIQPPSCNGDMREQMLEVYNTVNKLTDQQKKIASFWEDGPGSFKPPGHWFEIALDLVREHGTNTPRTARVFAYLGAVEMDASISVWDAKYTYWSIRPITYIRENIDPSWSTFLSTPTFPGYVSGHSGFSGAAEKLLGYMFPDRKAVLNSMAEEAALSRLLGGIHIRADNEVGLSMGRKIGSLAIARAMDDDVRDLVSKGILKQDQGNSLIEKLDEAIKRLNERNENAAIKELQAFIGQVDGLISGGAVSQKVGQPLIDSANDVINQFSAMD